MHTFGIGGRKTIEEMSYFELMSAKKETDNRLKAINILIGAIAIPIFAIGRLPGIVAGVFSVVSATAGVIYWAANVFDSNNIAAEMEYRRKTCCCGCTIS